MDSASLERSIVSGIGSGGPADGNHSDCNELFCVRVIRILPSGFEESAEGTGVAGVAGLGGGDEVGRCCPISLA